VPPPLFVVGCHRSGTTVVRRVLSTHPAIWLAKETQYLAFVEWRDGDWHRILTDDALRAHVFWANGFLVGTGWSRVPDPDAFLASGEARSRAGVYRWLCGVERPAGKAPGIWGDNTPRYVSLIPELDRAFPDARYIHVVRDPRDVVRSALEVWFGGNTALTAAEEWVERVGAGLAAQHLVGDRLLVLRFEDLLREPGPTLARVARFLDVDDRFRPNDTDGDAASVASQEHLKRVAEPLDPGVIGKYRDGLTAAQIRDVEQLCQPFLRAFGYPVEPWQASWNPTPRFGRYARDYVRSYAINVSRGVRRRLPW
jgi:hypothetical protein